MKFRIITLIGVLFFSCVRETSLPAFSGQLTFKGSVLTSRFNAPGYHISYTFDYIDGELASFNGNNNSRVDKIEYTVNDTLRVSGEYLFNQDSSEVSITFYIDDEFYGSFHGQKVQ